MRVIEERIPEHFGQMDTQESDVALAHVKRIPTPGRPTLAAGLSHVTLSHSFLFGGKLKRRKPDYTDPIQVKREIRAITGRDVAGNHITKRTTSSGLSEERFKRAQD